MDEIGIGIERSHSELSAYKKEANSLFTGVITTRDHPEKRSNKCRIRKPPQEGVLVLMSTPTSTGKRALERATVESQNRF